MILEDKHKRVWAEIGLGAIKSNFEAIRAAVSPERKICCIVKANAYGHGAIRLGQLYEELGADWLAVSSIEEALPLREAGIKLPILILGYTPVELAKDLAEQNISQCVYSTDYASSLSARAKEAGVRVKIHVKIDTGMGRIGFKKADEAYEACCLDGLQTEGIFTHFATADEGDFGKDFVELQYSRFIRIKQELESRGLVFSVSHCANSAATLDYPEYHMDMVRVGIILYGLYPSDDVSHSIELTPAMTLRSVVSHIKTIHAGDTVSYGRTFIADRDIKVATIPIGYADGFWRSNSTHETCITINGVRCRILGRVCMDQTMVDASRVPDLSIGSPDQGGSSVVIFGAAPAETAQDIAAANETIAYEVICAVGARVPRVYAEK